MSNAVQKVSALLAKLHERFPCDKARHAITYNGEELICSVVNNEKWYDFVLEGDDLENPEKTVDVIVGFMNG